MLVFHLAPFVWVKAISSSSKMATERGDIIGVSMKTNFPTHFHRLFFFRHLSGRRFCQKGKGGSSVCSQPQSEQRHEKCGEVHGGSYRMVSVLMMRRCSVAGAGCGFCASFFAAGTTVSTAAVLTAAFGVSVAGVAATGAASGAAAAGAAAAGATERAAVSEQETVRTANNTENIRFITGL